MDLLDQVRQRYKAIGNYDLNIIDSREKGISNGRKLEFYPPDERDNPTPGRPTVEIFDPSFQGDQAADMVAADFLHYLGKVDPVVSDLRRRFRESVTPEQMMMDRNAYNRAISGSYGYKETRPFDDWYDFHRLDQYLGSMFLPRESENYQDWDRVMTPKQRHILARIRQYLEQGQ